MKRFILLLCGTVISFMSAVSSPKSSTPQAPDFAYPKRVSAQAEKDLKSALKSGDGKTVLSASIRLGLATSAVSQGDLPPVIKRIEDIAAAEEDAVTRSLLYTLLAKIYFQLYLDKRHDYDERQLPLDTPYPDDIFAWSGDHFKTRIKEFTVEALKGENVLKAAKLEGYTPVITASATTLLFYPTLYDFVANEAIEIYSYLNNRNRFILNAKWVSTATNFEKLQAKHLPAQAAEVIELYQKLTRLHQGDNAPAVMTERNRLSWVSDYITLNDGDDTNMSLSALWIDAYHHYTDSDYAGLLLEKAAEAMSDVDDEKLFVKTAEEYLAIHPTAFNSNRIKYLIDNTKRPSIDIQSPQITSPGHATPIKITGKNLKECAVKVYSVGNSVDRYFRWDSKKSQSALLINSITVKFNDAAPCQNDTTINITLPRYGNYALMPEIKGVAPTNQMVNTIGCTDLALTTLSAKELSEAIVVNPVSGAPVGGVDIKWRKQLRDPLKPAGQTNDEGVLILAAGSESMEIYASKGGDLYSRGTDIWRNYIPDSRLSAELVTSLPLYHPGDTIDVAAVVYDCKLNGNTPAIGKRIKLTLRNANYIEIDSAGVTTDEWGRIQHRFAIPQSGLTGQFTILLTQSGTVIGRTSAMVSDYKLPTFEVIADKVKVIPDKDVDITGSTLTYSGFPLADTEVTIALSNTSPWRGYGFSDNQPPFYTATVKTDETGRFRFAIPQEVLDNAPRADHPFKAQITAVSPSGESRDATTIFVNRKIYMINAEIPDIIDAATPVKVSADVIGSDDTKTDFVVTATILTHNGDEIEKRQLSKNAEWSFADYKSGRYSIRFTAADTTIKCRPAMRSIIVYRETDTISPVESPLWVPKSSFTATGSERRAEVFYAAASDSLHLYYVAVGINGVAAKGWLRPHKGMNKLNITIPAGEKQLKLKMMTVTGLERDEEELTINTPESLRNLTVGVETFRDKVTPGAEERVTFSIKDNEGSPVTAAMMVEMYNRAISQIAPQQFAINPNRLYRPWILTNSVAGATFGVYANKDIKYVAGITPSTPQFNLYGRSFSGLSMRVRGARLTSLAIASDEEVAEVKNTAKVYRNTDVANDVSLNEAVVEESLAASPQAATTDGGYGTAGESDAEPDFAYRDAETPLAFFRPMLKTDSEGRMELTYTVPNANTTWVLAALAYDNEMLSSSTTREIIASKPIMVQPNCPRFLRMGDKAVIRSNVMNATDTTQEIVTVFEFFDPASGKTIGSTSSTDRISRGESTIVKAEIIAPMDVVMLGYRVKSSTGLYADGEQGIIPVLESVQPIIESKPFYIAADTTRFSMQLQPSPAHSRRTLQFCENPTWYAVTALPGLRAKGDRSSLSASAAIFSAAVADGILKSNPEIKTALHRWTTSDRSDSTLVSMLERNQDLKIVMLQASPWMLDARSDSERMDRLALLFDRKEIQSTYDINIDALAKMQCHGGGWSWIPEYKETSYWATLSVLEEMGNLRRLGYLPADKRLQTMIDNAVSYIDRTAAEQYRKYPKGDYTHYVAVRDMFPDLKQSTAASRVTKATLQRIIAGWKEFNVTDKAIAALILNAHSYAATARNILSSLDEYSASSPSMGMWWPSLDELTYSRYSKIGAASIILDAYQAVTPSSKAIDKIRQWIVVQKEAQDWKDGVVTSQVISSLLTSGSKWTVPARGSIVSIDGKKIEPQAIEKVTGYFRNNITDLAAKGGALEVVKPGLYPSWGAVITQAKLLMVDLKPSACEAVSIEKRYFKATNTPQGVTWVETENYNVGDRIKIDLLITANRDMDYVAITDQRSACLEPVEQLPKPIISQGIYFYRENRDAVTNIFVDHLPKGTYHLNYEMNVNNAGRFSAGVATLQSQYAPALTAHSAGAILTVEP